MRVTPDRVEFAWSPTYVRAIKLRIENKAFADVAPVKHRLIPSRSASYTEKPESIHFTLNPNQSFASAYFSCFDGRMVSAALPPLNNANSIWGVSGITSLISDRGGQGVAPEKGSSARSDIDSLLADEQAKKRR